LFKEDEMDPYTDESHAQLQVQVKEKLLWKKAPETVV
jgi:hypothetical protein